MNFSLRDNWLVMTDRKSYIGLWIFCKTVVLCSVVSGAWIYSSIDLVGTVVYELEILKTSSCLEHGYYFVELWICVACIFVWPGLAWPLTPAPSAFACLPCVAVLTEMAANWRHSHLLFQHFDCIATYCVSRTWLWHFLCCCPPILYTLFHL